VTGSLVHYLAADVLRSQRWVAPLLAFLAGVAVSNAAGGPLLTTYADTATVLLPVSVWLTVAVANSEDPLQAAITAVTVGGDLRLRLAKLLTAWTGCAFVAAPAVLWPLVARSYTGPAAGRDVAAGVAAHLLVALFGVGIGSLGMRAVLGRPGYTMLCATGLCLADVLVPHAPPTRRILELFDDAAVGGLAPVALGTAVLSAALIATSLGIARRRS
jgi:hypothetical protein